MLTLDSTKALFAVLIMFSLAYPLQGQVCENPQYITSRLERPEDFTHAKNRIEFDAVINDETCAFGGTSVNWNCSSSTLQNESWLLIKIDETNTNGFALNISTEENLGIDASLWGPFSTTQFNANEALSERPTHCTVSGGEGNIVLFSGYSGAYYILGLHNESNEPGKIIIKNTHASSSVTLSHFTPQEEDCILPTAELISSHLLIREEENELFVPRIRFTGEPPFYFKIKHGNYDYSSPSNVYDWQTWSATITDYIWELSSVRNECGTGKIIDNHINRMVYKKGKHLLSCIPFNSNFDDMQNGSSFTSTRATFTDDKAGNTEMAIGFNGIDEYLEFPGRDLIGENYVISMWVYPEKLTDSTQSILSLGSSLEQTQKLELINGQFIFTSVLRENQIYTASILAEMNEWQHITLVKNEDMIKIISDKNGENSVNLTAFEVPAYGVHSKLFFGAENGASSYFKGSLDNFKYLTGTYTDSVRHRITTNNSCKLELCDSLPRFELPGYRNFVRGVYRAQERLIMRSFPEDVMLYQIGDRPFQKSIPYYGDYSHDFYNFYIQEDDNYETITHFDGKCGTGVLVDTMAYYTAAELVLCYPLNNNTNEFFKLPHESNIGDYDNDQNDNTLSAAKFETNTILTTTFSGRVLHSNYSASFRFKASENMLTTKEYELFSYKQSAQEDRCYLKKFSNGTYKIFFQKQQMNKTFSVNLPDITNSWEHLVLVFQSGDQYATGYIKLYLNGKELLNVHTSFTNTLANATTFTIGNANQTSIRKSFIGLIDDFKLFTGALSKEEVNTLYNSTSECHVLLCDEIPEIIKTVPNEVIINYNERFGINYLLKGRGPWQVEYNLNESGSLFEKFETNPELLPQSTYNTYRFSNIGENEFIINSIKNVCGYSVLNDTTKVYIKPAVLHCLMFTNSILKPELEPYNPEISNVNLVPDLNNISNQALKFNSNSNFKFTHPASLEKTIYDLNVSLWLKPENDLDTMTLFAIGGPTDYYKALLVKQNNAYRVIVKRQGHGFNSGSLNEIQSQTLLEPEQWSFLSVNMLNSRIVLRINGNIDTDLTKNGPGYPAFINKDIVFSFGSSFDNDFPYTGVMDDIKVIQGKINNYEANAIINSKNCDFNFCPEDRVTPPILESPAVYQSLNTIYSKSKVSSQLNFSSLKSIELNDGFETTEGAIFNADIKGCPY